MRMTRDQLHDRMASLSSDELRAIQTAPSDEYIPEAREAAVHELSLRANWVVSEEIHETSPPPKTRWHWFVRVRDAWRDLRSAVHDGWRRVPREDLPYGLRSLFWAGVAGAFALVGLIVPELFHGGDLQGGLSAAAGEVSQHLYTTLFGAIGLLLVYGICTERTYPRWVAIGIVVLMPAHTLFEQLRSGTVSSDLVVLPLGAWAVIRYLRENEEVVDYYFRIRHGVSRRLAELRLEPSLPMQRL